MVDERLSTLESEMLAVRAAQRRIDHGLKPLVSMSAPPVFLSRVLHELTQIGSCQHRIEDMLLPGNVAPKTKREEIEGLRMQLSQAIDRMKVSQSDALLAAEESLVDLEKLFSFMSLPAESDGAVPLDDSECVEMSLPSVRTLRSPDASAEMKTSSSEQSATESVFSSATQDLDESSGSGSLVDVTLSDVSVRFPEQVRRSQRSSFRLHRTQEPSLIARTSERIYTSLTASQECGCRESEDSSSTFVVPPTLPPLWPQVLELRQHMEDGPKKVRRSNTLDGWRKTTTSGRYSVKDADMYDLKNEGRSCRFSVIHPASKSRLAIDVASLCILVVDLTLTPYVLAWDVPYEGFILVWSWFTVGLWTVDVGLNFMSGYTRDGEVVLNFRATALRYMRTWFGLDLVIVSSDWVSTVISAVTQGTSSTRGMRLFRLAKLSRIFRIAGLLRVFRLARVGEELLEKVVSGGALDVAKIIGILVLYLWINHIVCCCLFFVGRTFPTDTGANWLKNDLVIGDVSFTYENVAPLYQYATAFNWALAQTTLGAIEIVASNSWERFANVALLLFGLLLSASLVSTLSALLIGFQMSASARTETLKKLRLFLRQNNVDPLVAIRVRQQVENRLRMEVMLTDRDVPALDYLSATLFSEMRYAMFGQTLIQLPIFRLWNSLSAQVTRSFCADSVENKFLVPKDDVFTAGTEGEVAYHVSSGIVDYVQTPDSSLVLRETVVQVATGTWLCEAALWTHWIHVGTASTDTPCQLICVKADGMMQTLSKHRVIQEVTAEYGRQFHRRVVSARPPQTAWPSDIEVPFAEYAELVVGMSFEARRVVGMDALQHIPAPTLFQWSAAGQDKVAALEKEVSNGTSTLLINAEGNTERVVSVVLIHIDSLGDEMFVQVGKLRDGKRELEVRLPGGKLRPDEMPGDRAKEILLSKLGPVADFMEIVSSRQQVEWKQSKQYAVRTMYIKTIFQALAVDQFQIPSVSLEIADHSLRGGREDSENLFHDSLKPRKLYAFREEDGTISLYAWVPRDDFEHWVKGGSEKQLQSWIQTTRLDTRCIVAADEFLQVGATLDEPLATPTTSQILSPIAFATA